MQSLNNQNNLMKNIIDDTASKLANAKTQDEYH